MKTILLPLILVISIASGLYGQSNLASNDSLKISIQEFFSIEKMRRDYSLLGAQYQALESQSQEREIVINAQRLQISQLHHKQATTMAYTLKLEKQYKKKKRQTHLLKFTVPLAVVAGFILGSK